MKELKNLFSQQGKLSKILTDYSAREGQTEMALDINLAIQEKTSLIIEAGTGIGKTFAYLAPVLMNGKKTIISTGTKTLQDQLYNRASVIEFLKYHNNKNQSVAQKECKK